MSLESVRAFFAEKAPDISVIESTQSSATVPLAALAYGVEPARIAKTLSLRVGERVVLIVTSGTSRMPQSRRAISEESGSRAMRRPASKPSPIRSTVASLRCRSIDTSG